MTLCNLVDECENENLKERGSANLRTGCPLQLKHDEQVQELKDEEASAISQIIMRQ